MASPTDRPAPPLRTLLVSAGALVVPVAAQAIAPESAVEYELLLWLVALIPAFLLAYHRGWRGAATALAVGMAVLSTTQATLLYLGHGVEDWLFLLAVVGVFVGVTIGIGWVTELLHRAREEARAMELSARESEARARELALRLEVVAQAAAGIVAAPDAASLGELVREACARVMPLDAFRFQLVDADRPLLVPLVGDPEAFPPGAQAGAADAVLERRTRVMRGEATEEPRSVVHVPVMAAERVLGVISVGAGDASGPTEEDLRVLDALAAGAAGALLNLEALGAREAADQALRRSEARFRSLVEDASELIVILDARGRVRYASPAVARLVGPRVAGGERSVFGRVHPRERATVRSRFEALFGERGGTLATELRVRHLDGSWRTLELLGTNLAHDPAVGGVVVNARDVTAQREAVAQLRESEHRYRRFFQNDLTGDYLADAHGTLLECNPRFAEIFGFPSAAAARGASLGSLFACGSRSLDAMREQLGRDGWVESMELRMCARDERELHVLKNAVGIFDEHGELAQILGYVFDVSEHRRTEEALRQSQKLEAVGQLAGGVAHDFNNILTAVVGFAYLVEDAVEPGSRAAQYTNEIRAAAMRASDLTHQLLAFSRRQALLPRFVDPNRAVASAEQMLRRLLPESIEMEAHLGEIAGSIRVDPAGFQQVLLNLVVNARDAMPQGGHLFVTTRGVSLSAAEAARVAGTPPAGDYVLLSVRDTGSGMDPATLQRIFEPFYTTKPPGRGTGLGLSTVHGIVHQSGGYMQVDSTPGAGSTFTILFPRHDAAEAASTRDEPAEPQEPATGGATVLLVEDEAAVRRPIRLALELAGFSVLAASDGEEALLVADVYGKELDLLVTDAVMPRMGGVELAEMLRRRQPDLGVVMVSGYPSPPQGEGAFHLSGRCAFLSKPVQPRRLIAAMHEVLNGPSA